MGGQKKRKFNKPRLLATLEYDRSGFELSNYLSSFVCLIAYADLTADVKMRFVIALVIARPC